MFSFLDRVKRFFVAADSGGRSDPLSDFWYQPVGGVSHSGEGVSASAALGVSAVYACVRVLAETLGGLPWRIYETTDDPREKKIAREHPLWNVLHRRPNPWQTPFEFRAMGVAHVCLRGNFFCLQRRDARGALALWPLHPDRMRVEQLDDGALRYTYTPPGGRAETYSQEEMYHVRGPAHNSLGIVGESLLGFARHAIGGAITKEKHGGAVFRNGGMQPLYIKRPAEARWTPQAITNFRAGWRTLHGGPENAGNPPILEDGMTLESIGLNMKDSQWLEARAFDAVEICRFFGVQPHMIGILDRATFSNIEQQSIEYVTYTVLPWCFRFEQSADRDLLDEDTDYYTKLTVDGLLRGDIAARYGAYNIGVQGGWLTRNEVRELEDRNPLAGGDVPLEPMNMQPAGGAADQRQQQGQRPARRPPPPEPEEDEAAEARSARFRPLLRDAAERIAAHEIKGLAARAHRAAEDAAKWSDFASAFYAKHRVYLAKTLRPIEDAWEAVDGAPPQASDDAALIAPAAVFDPAVDQPALLAGWSTTRAAEIFLTLCVAFGIEENEP